MKKTPQLIAGNNQEIFVILGLSDGRHAVIQHLRTVEIEQAKGTSLEGAVRKVGVTPQTIVRWKGEYGGLRVDQAKRLKELEQENTRLKKIVADLSVDNSILKEVARGNF